MDPNLAVVLIALVGIVVPVLKEVRDWRRYRLTNEKLDKVEATSEAAKENVEIARNLAATIATFAATQRELRGAVTSVLEKMLTLTMQVNALEERIQSLFVQLGALEARLRDIDSA